ncbi:hypothetical protein [Heliophilum fasciatum]|uniref:Uncharacterized protein n=1 Tax=Heliophilum fasciatum TaxID=35700 RepID=A0A4R2RNV5_9FIRM|nr:hypothetical protein [Heliophilum fasciatum]MCW2277741.1 hypothetical protein [Heliophilum fasciatum]TCP64764.1 hypothetical protein EDD73_108117 [Heliophilum fasciatum]
MIKPPTKQENRQMIAKALECHRSKLKEEQYEKLVDEINDMNYPYTIKTIALLNNSNGALDANAKEHDKLSREETMKWIEIRQKYGV